MRSNTPGMGMHKHATSGKTPKSPKFRYNARLAAEGTAGKQKATNKRASAKVRAEKWQQKRKRRR